jgi:branched-chain amino acid transport system substrate-binding protein
MLQEKYGLKSGWNAMTIMGLAQSMAAARAIEHTIKSQGADKVTGQTVYDTLMKTKFTSAELMGIMAGMDFSPENPFPTASSKLNIVTMKEDGKVVRAAGDIPMPTVPKW